MARLELEVGGEPTRITAVVTLSRRNCLALLSKLTYPSARTLVNTDCVINGRRPPDDACVLVLRIEDDPEHYGGRESSPGEMHPLSEAFIREHGEEPGEQ